MDPPRRHRQHRPDPDAVLGVPLQLAGHRPTRSQRSSGPQVENQLQRRADLIPNLVETVKGSAAHEKEVIGQRHQRARQAGRRAAARCRRAAADAELTSALSRLLVVVENYPQLKANENFNPPAGRAGRHREPHRRPSAGRYNEAVSEFNATIKRFPNNMFAGMFGFDSKEYFQAAEGAQKVPQVESDPRVAHLRRRLKLRTAKTRRARNRTAKATRRRAFGAFGALAVPFRVLRVFAVQLRRRRGAARGRSGGRSPRRPGR